MTKILYGVAGEGMGHALRSKAIIDHLLEKGHEIRILSSHRAYEFLKKEYNLAYDIFGLHICYENNEVKNFATVFENSIELPKGTIKTISEINKVLNEFKPELIITDFEPYCYYLAKIRRLPCIAIDNINMLTRTKINFSKKFKQDYRLAKTATKLIAPFADQFLLTTFFFPKRIYKNTLLYPPIIRKEVIAEKKKRKKSKESHILVYQTSQSNTNLLELLKTIDEKFIIYGFNQDKKDGNLEFKNFSLDGFVKDLHNSKGIITNGGFTLISEALFLNRPILSEPVRKQFEQILNATYIQKLGYGLFTEKIVKEDILKFLNNLKKYKNNISKFKQKNNLKLFNKLDDIIPKIIVKNKNLWSLSKLKLRLKRIKISKTNNKF